MAGMFLEKFHKVISNTQTVYIQCFRKASKDINKSNICLISNSERNIGALFTYSPAYMLNAFYLSVLTVWKNDFFEGYFGLRWRVQYVIMINNVYYYRWEMAFTKHILYTPNHLLPLFSASLRKNLKVNCCFHPTKRISLSLSLSLSVKWKDTSFPKRNK